MNKNGKVATYIPILARADPDSWGVSVCTVDGQRHSIGDVKDPFTIQSVSKTLTYASILNDRGSEKVHEYIGYEPSGHSFNKIRLDVNGKPHNPMINTGAILACSLLKPEMDKRQRFNYVKNKFQNLAGGEFMRKNLGAFLSEKDNADQNFAIAYYMKANKCFPEGTILEEVLDLYFQLCAIDINCESGAVIAATLANGGVCPITDDHLLRSETVQDTLSLMFSCGMYDYSGQFAFKVGLPAKSGVSGCIILVVPKVMGVCLWSPPLDQWGNSCRGIEFCENFNEQFHFHNFDIGKEMTLRQRHTSRSKYQNKAMEVVKVLFGAFKGDVTAMRRYALQGVEMNQQDYDGRTALHVAAAEGHLNVVNFLLEECHVDFRLKDRWGYTPLEEAKRFGKKDIEELLEQMAGYEVET
ncbi:glutaminase kidney isoform, mitochondrial-like isoform X1 [Pecten maximus]|uniref:glutaminase kidney isoform, mitochondrial-like isoform X1 n=1 Tax=Pecten maximus TaxID=6579 RepID=UPI0014587ACE|nr:glutaminase kidney isoform, mitochondrial-like isoform X1 [Pecten maximus]